jgi:hypothetical protein
VSHPHPALILGVFDKQPADKVLGQLTGAAKVLLIKVVVHSRDVGQGLLLGLTQERGCTTEAGRWMDVEFIKEDGSAVCPPPPPEFQGTGNGLHTEADGNLRHSHTCGPSPPGPLATHTKAPKTPRGSIPANSASGAMQSQSISPNCPVTRKGTAVTFKRTVLTDTHQPGEDLHCWEPRALMPREQGACSYGSQLIMKEWQMSPKWGVLQNTLAKSQGHAGRGQA